MGLESKVSIVTGAARGLGKAISLTLAREGCTVIVSDIDIDGANGVVKEIRRIGRDGMSVKADVSKKSDVEVMVKKTVSKYGRIDILVNNAGICSLTPIIEITEEEWDKVLSINLKGTFFCSQAVFKEMMKKKYGKIVNIASLAGKVGGIVTGAHYSASKAGVICLTKSFALQAAPYKINVNAVCPGPQDTEMTMVWGDKANTEFKEKIPFKEYGKPEDVAEAVLFLVSEKSSYVTGEILDVNGGLYMD